MNPVTNVLRTSFAAAALALVGPFAPASAQTSLASLLSQYPQSPLHGVDITIAALEEAALRQDPLALTVVKEAAQHLGSAVAGVLNLLNPEAVIIGGSLARLGETLLAPMRVAIRSRTLVNSLAASAIRTSALGPQDIAIGAATLVLERALADPQAFPAMGRGGSR